MELTREEIEQMPAGREMDKLIAELVLKIPVKEICLYGTCDWYARREDRPWEQLLSYSNTMGDAWQMEGEVLHDFELIAEEGQYSVGCTTPEYGMHWANGETGPLAIARLALLSTLFPSGPAHE